MILEISTPALLFPAVSLLFLSYTNRFLHLAALIRELHRDWQNSGESAALAQINNIRRRLVLIRWMQLLGAASLFLCVVSMVSVLASVHLLALAGFSAALVLMALSLGFLIFEIYVSGGALQILLSKIENRERS
ncbi:MAG: DUF2721 domain-containing protein [Verrucomicrobiales bacterium]|nr:DUF2721 domain-containing protein [Verrucomicrobiales bacterium]